MKKLNITSLFRVDDFRLNKQKLDKNRIVIFAIIVVLSIVLKIILIPYTMVHGEAVTRIWAAWNWAQNPFFILPNLNHPFHYYLMGSIIYIFRDLYYVPLLTTITIVTLSGIFLFKTAYLLSNYRTALITYFLFTLSPAIFRLNYDPYPYSLTPLFFTITTYYLIQALFDENSRKYFILAGIFTFLASFTRPEAIFVIVCFCAVALFSRKRGYITFIILSLWFQIFWILLSLILFGSPFATFDNAADYPNIFDIHGLNLALRLKGFFLPYYYLFMGMTILVFYFFVRGVYIAYKEYPKIISIVLLIPLLVSAVTNGTASLRTTMFHSTYYIFSMFFFGSLFAAFGLDKFISRFKTNLTRAVLASVVIVSAIPLSYLKDFVPQKFKGLFPKVVQFLETAPYPSEVRIICGTIDESVEQYSSLILDAERIPETTILYIPLRTRLTPDKIMIIYGGAGNTEPEPIRTTKEFILKNSRGIMVVQNDSTFFNRLLGSGAVQNWNTGINLSLKTEHWSVYLYEMNK